MDPKLFGRYQIIRKLAGGGMGRVFLAYDPVLNRQVGLKLIDAGGDRDSLDVIEAERRGATLQDQLAKREASGRVAQIFDVGEREGYFYIAMEYIEGEDLWELMARGPLPAERAVSIALDILDVLTKAHTFQTVIEERAHRGIIHGDIKPRNVRITTAGQVKVLDFGIAKAVSMTRSITFNQFGSIPYSSPERLQTGDMDARSDVWSVAIVLFEMLTGQPYFEAEASSKLEWMIRNYKALQPAMEKVQPGLREILSRALDPDLNRRFASAAAFQQALHEWQGYARPAQAASAGDPDATRRTAYQSTQDYTRRSNAPIPPPAAVARPGGMRRGLVKPFLKASLVISVTLFLAGVFTVVYEIRMYNNADALRKKIDSGQLGMDDGAKAYRTLAKQSLFALPLWPARNSLRDRYVAEADRVLADYREASESTPVYLRDWKRAQSALGSAVLMAPEDKAIRGRAKLVDGHLLRLLRAKDLRSARSDFEEARSLLPHSPDPHLGLALIYIAEGDLDQAESELNEAQRNGFRPGRREQKGLADGYTRRGEQWITQAKLAHDITQMEDALKHADSDLAHAESLYNSVAPFMNGIQLAEKVSLERDKAAKNFDGSAAGAEPARSGLRGGHSLMAVTRSTPENRAAMRQQPIGPGRASRMPELVWLIAAAVIVCGAWWLVYSAKVRRASMPAPVVVLSELDRAEQLYPVLSVFAGAGDREFVARRIIDTLADREGNLPNTGALARIRVPRGDVIGNRKLDELRDRAANASGETITLLTPAEFAQIKPQIAVRSTARFRREFVLWTGVILAAFFLTHFIWTMRGFTGPWAFLPLLLILTGIGFGLMVALRDPVRDILIFVPFAEGVSAGCLMMLAASFVDWEAATAGYSFVPLLGAVVLSIALIFFGSGPGGSDARVNLGPFQPVEAIKILLVFFVAGYFAKRWPLLRELREKRFVIPGVEMPPLEYAAPVLIGVAVALLFFYLQKDLGPALVFASVFLTLYAVARNRIGLAVSGLAGLLGGFLIGYFAGIPKTVHDRVAMWLSPWSNTVHGGDQVVHSLWAMASGGTLGTGPGLGESDVIPAGYTDLIVSALGEEWGFAGLAAVYAIFGLLIWMGLRVARRARTDYAFFLALGLSLLVSAELLLISGGILDLFPLSGVATPFLSYGRTAMLANFLIAGILLALGRQQGPTARTAPFHSGLRWVEIVLCALMLAVVGKAAYVQLAHADAIAGEGTLVLQADGGRRFIYNPRLISAARTLERGGIYDRTGLPLASSNWSELETHRAQYSAMGIDLDRACHRTDPRCYPFGALTFHLLGDIRTRANWSAQNSSLVERDDAVRLQGYDDRAHIVEVKDAAGKPFYSVRYDYRELLPLLRHRWEPDDPAVKRVRDRDRNVHLSVHAGFQVKVGQILKARLAEQHLERGSVVVMDPGTGDLLASVNLPAPEFEQQKLALGQAAGALLDRAQYGLYPPGSTFKIVTAIAALRLDPTLAHQQYQCVRLPDGRTGNFVGNSKRPIRDDLEDKVPHGTLDMNQAIVVSCNAYFAQLGTYKVGAEQLLETAKLIGISVANPATVKNLRPQMPQISYGQGQVVVSPFQMARVAAAVAAGGNLPFGRWILDSSNTRTTAPQPLLAANLAEVLAKDMRGVVTNGTGKSLAAIQPAIAGKTGTAELASAPSHAWFIGFAPYNAGRRIAFSILAENGHYGGTAAAPIAGDLTRAAKQTGLIQ